MAIVDYTSLQDSVAAWLHRDDLGPVIPDFVSIAEARLNADLNARAMEVRSTLTCVPTSDLTGRLVALPAGMLEMRRLMMVDSDPVIVLEYKSPDSLAEDRPFLLAQARPTCFTVVGNFIELSPPPDSPYPMELVWKQKIPPLALNSVNWLITANPSAYLFATLVASAVYTQNDDRLPGWEAQYQKEVASINSEDWYSGSTMRVRAR